MSHAKSPCQIKRPTRRVYGVTLFGLILLLTACGKPGSSAPSQDKIVTQPGSIVAPSPVPTPSPTPNPNCAKNMLAPTPGAFTDVGLSFCGDQLLLAGQYAAFRMYRFNNEVLEEMPQGVVYHGPLCDYENVAQRPFCMPY